MAYFESEPAGATGINNSAPVVLATNHNWPIPTYFAPIGPNCVSGCTAMRPPNFGVTVIPGPPAGYNLYVSSIQVSFFDGLLASSCYYAFKAGSNTGAVLFYAYPSASNATSVLSFRTPIKVGATGLFVIGSTGLTTASAGHPVSAQGMYVPI